MVQPLSCTVLNCTQVKNEAYKSHIDSNSNLSMPLQWCYFQSGFHLKGFFYLEEWVVPLGKQKSIHTYSPLPENRSSNITQQMVRHGPENCPHQSRYLRIIYVFHLTNIWQNPKQHGHYATQNFLVDNLNYYIFKGVNFF